MKVKQLEIRDRATFIPALAIQVSGADGYLLRRAGYGTDMCIILVHLAGNRCTYDPYDWTGSRTMQVAHEWIRQHWDEIVDEQVVDVEFILGESSQPKTSERVPATMTESETKGATQVVADGGGLLIKPSQLQKDTND